MLLCNTHTAEQLFYLNTHIVMKFIKKPSAGLKTPIKKYIMGEEYLKQTKKVNKCKNALNYLLCSFLPINIKFKVIS